MHNSPTKISQSWWSRLFRRTPKQKKKVLFVCTGNTCRSPMAMTLMRNALGKDLANYEIESAGIAAYGEPASEHAKATMKERGLNLDEHMSRKLTKEMVDNADIIFAMSQSHVLRIKELSPNANVYLLDEKGVADPYGGNLDKYRQSADQIGQAVENRRDMLKNLQPKKREAPSVV